eukprot:gene32363-5054_t
METAAGPIAHIIRVMPNTPCLVAAAAAAMCLGSKATPGDESVVRTLFEAVGKIYTVTEAMLAGVTGVSGSGPAYIYLVIEAMADGGVRAGLPRDVAQALAAQTVFGSAKMVLETGVHELEKAGIRAAFMNTVVAAANRAIELSKL